jgi:conjugative relaxase-like TrwC/TraI family protein
LHWQCADANRSRFPVSWEAVGREVRCAPTVTMTCHVLHAGDGYTYLTRQVATGDHARSGSDPLVAYYQAAGNPPGQWVGSGCVDVAMSGEVTEEHMLALFGEALRPDANEFIADLVAAGDTFDKALAKARLGRRFARYDSENPFQQAITTAYATFERAEQRRPSVEERADIKETLARAFLRKRHPGERPPKRAAVHAFLADELGKARQPVAGFDLVFSPVKGVSLLWALGGHRIRTAVEEIHETAWRAALAYGEREGAFTRIGAGGVAQVPTSGFVAVAFQHRDSRAGDPDLHTHVAVSNRVLAEDGTWRTIDGRQLLTIAVTMSEIYNAGIEQGAVERFGVQFADVLRSDEKRVVREVVGMPGEWQRGFSRRRAQVETGYDALVRDYVRRHGRTPPRSVQMKLAQQAALTDRPVKTELTPLAEQVAEWRSRARDMMPGVDVSATIAACMNRVAPGPVDGQVDVAVVAAVVIARVAQDRATWTIYHVHAEAQRQLRPIVFGSAEARAEAVDEVVGHALLEQSIQLDIDVDAVPHLLQRQPDGESVFVRRGSRRFTSETILSAEARLTETANTRRGPVVPDGVRRRAIARFRDASGKNLNAGQRLLVEHFVSSGRALAVAIGPPGTGKSTAMAAVREAWETTGNRVIGLAPSAAAASVLGDELGIRAGTMHMLVTAHRAGEDTGIRRGDMLLVDEAGMAGTLIVDKIREIAQQHGAVLRLVGDHRQLAAVEAGGALRLLVADAGGIELTEVHRFVREDEADAVLQLRVGDERCVDFYADNHRLFGGVQVAALDRLYLDWQSDREAGRASIMISDSNDVVRDLSLRAQTERRAAGLVSPSGVELHDGNVAGIGDLVVTRRNKRRLTVNGGRDYVKNGDLWVVESRMFGGRLRVRHLGHGGSVILPGWYVEEYVELGYAATVHRSQGLTVEIARCFLTLAATREAALVALSRGTHGNYAYLDTEQLLDVDEPFVLPGDLFYRNRDTTDAAEALRAILRHEGAEPSATEVLRDALDGPYRLSDLVPQFSFALHLHRGRDAVTQAEEWVRSAIPDRAEGIFADEAWSELQQVLHEVHDTGTDPVRLLVSRVVQRELDTAISVAKVLHFRVTERMPTHRPGPHRPDLLPGWVASPPGTTDFPTAGQLPESARTRPPPAETVERVVGGARSDQLMLFMSRQDVGAEPVATDQLGLFGPAVPLAAVGPEEFSVVESEGPDPEQLLLFSTPSEWAAAPDVDPDQFALFSAAAPRHQADRIELGGWLNDRADRIADRVRTLGERAADDPPVWALSLGAVPADPVGRDRWIVVAGHVAAYRERWAIPDEVPELLPAHARGQQGRARTWVEHYLTESAWAPRWDHASPRPTGRAAPAEPPAAGPARAAPDDWAAAAQARARRRDEQQLKHAERVAADQQRQDDAAGLLQEVWRHEPTLVETIIAADAFPALARRLADAAAAGYDLHGVLADIRLDATTWSTIADPAAYASRAVDRVVERLRGGAPTASVRAARHRDQLEELDRLRTQASELLTEIWPTRSTLIIAIIAAPAFDALARTIGRHSDAGLDLHDLLATVPVARIQRDSVRDKAAYTTYVLNKVVDQRNGAAEADRALSVAQLERRETLRAAAQLLRHAWAAAPEAAERVIAGQVFDIFADRMATAADNGHDVEAVLARLDPAVLTAPRAPQGSTIIAFGRAIKADRAAVIDPPVDARPAGTLQRGPAQPQTDELTRVTIAENALRSLWGADADRIISNHAGSVERLAGELDKARQAGYDPADFFRAAAHASGQTQLQQLTPAATAPASGTTPRPTTTYGSDIPHPGEPGTDPASAAADWVRRHLQNELSARPGPAIDRASAPAAPDLDAPTPDLEDARNPEPADPEPHRSTIEVAAQQGKHWTTREFGKLTDTALDQELVAQRRRAGELSRQRTQAEATVEEIASQVAAKAGPNAAAVDRELENVRERIATVDNALRIEQAWQVVSAQAAHDAGERARARHELGALGRMSRARRAELSQRIAELTTAEQQAHAHADELANQLAQAQHAAGRRDQYPLIRRLAQDFEQTYERERDAAHGRDLEVLAAARLQTQHTINAERTAAERQHALETEYALRGSLPPDVARLENAERGLHPDPVHAGPGIDDTEPAPVPHPALAPEDAAIHDIEQRHGHVPPRDLER